MGSYPIFSSNINDTQLPCVFEEKKAGTNFLNTNNFVVQTDAKFSFFISRFETRPLGLSFRLSALMDKSFLKVCGRIVFGYMFSLC